ncbi:hypothetical protein ACKLNO_00760 [Neisseriaceae bacterium B1]
MNKFIFISLTAIVLSACGSVGNTFLSDEKLQVKAAQTLRTSPSKVMITERNAGLDDIKFNATINGKTHYCYVTTTGVNASDAICSDMKPKLKVKVES